MAIECVMDEAVEIGGVEITVSPDDNSKNPWTTAYVRSSPAMRASAKGKDAALGKLVRQFGDDIWRAK